MYPYGQELFVTIWYSRMICIVPYFGAIIFIASDSCCYLGYNLYIIGFLSYKELSHPLNHFPFTDFASDGPQTIFR